jgi:hypothetical protein
MSEADLFRQYAKEAMHRSSKAVTENEKRNLIDLACTWLQAALMGERVLGSSFISSPRNVGEATTLTGFCSSRPLRTPHFPFGTAWGRRTVTSA